MKEPSTKEFIPGEDYFGVGLFKPLPGDHPFQKAAYIHDCEFGLAETAENPKTRAQVDAEFFENLTRIAREAKHFKTQCELMETICLYWPFARKFGKFFWDGEE